MQVLLVLIIIAIGGIVGVVSKKIKNNSKKNGNNVEPTKFYVIFEDGFERKLKFVERKTDYSSKEPYYGKYYNRFVDDLGRYWRSYDENKTFMKETLDGYLKYE